MTPDALKETVDDLVTFLIALDKVVPNKIDEELVSFLQGLNGHPWILAMLSQSLNMAKTLGDKLKK